MGLTETSVRASVRQPELDDGVREDGLTTAERAEIAQLRRELRETREERAEPAVARRLGHSTL